MTGTKGLKYRILKRMFLSILAFLVFIVKVMADYHVIHVPKCIIKHLMY